MTKKNWTFQERMRYFGARFPSPTADPNEILLRSARLRFNQMDLSYRNKAEQVVAKMPAFMQVRFEGGSGFAISKTIRSFFLEYNDRLMHHGPHSLPSSFNVIGGFLEFSEEFLLFDIAEEKEHLFRLEDYLEWYTGGGYPEEPQSLKAIMGEGIIYEYNTISPMADFEIVTRESSLRITGVALCRHANELSTVVVAGESPPFPPDGYMETGELIPFKGRESIQPAGNLTVGDRYLPELPGHSRVILATRFNIDCRQFDVRYINLDLGKSYRVFTDDRVCLPDEEPAEKIDMEEGLLRYSELLSALASMIYLPAYFSDIEQNRSEVRIATELHANRKRKDVREAIKILGAANVPFFRTIHVLPPKIDSASGGKESRTVSPPDFEFATSGFWKPIPGRVGVDSDGNTVAGKTWVERVDSWKSTSLEAFVVAGQARANKEGECPGVIYIMRNAAHQMNVFKIGLTRRTSDERAAELSSATSSPLKFTVLTEWEVGDCVKVEKMVHERLQRFRMNDRREFFCGPLNVLVNEINGILNDCL